MAKNGKYDKEIVTRICEMLREGDYTVKDICLSVGIHMDTYYEWLKVKPEFKAAAEKAIEAEKAERWDRHRQAAGRGLLTLLEGKEYKEVSTEYTFDRNGKPKIKSRKVANKVILPNATSVIFALKNLEKDTYKDVVNNEISGKDGEPLQNTVIVLPANNRNDTG